MCLYKLFHFFLRVHHPPFEFSLWASAITLVFLMTFNKWVGFFRFLSLFHFIVEWLPYFEAKPDRIDIIKLNGSIRFNASVVSVSSDAVTFMIIYTVATAQYQWHHLDRVLFYKFQFHQVIKHMQPKAMRKRMSHQEMSIFTLDTHWNENGNFFFQERVWNRVEKKM